MKKSAILTLSMGFLLLFAWHIQAIDTPEAREHATKIRALALSHATVNNIEIAYKVIGEDDHPAVLLIMGLGASHILWGDNLVMQLVDAGYRIVLFDNRDTGDSQRLEEFGQPLLWWQLLKARFGFDVDADYTLEDMAQDSVALLDELDIEQAHIVGASMGGMIAQALAHAPTALAESDWRAATAPGVFGRQRSVPYALVGVIAPWNFPIVLGVRKVAPAGPMRRNVRTGSALYVLPNTVAAEIGASRAARRTTTGDCVTVHSTSSMLDDSAPMSSSALTSRYVSAPPVPGTADTSGAGPQK